MTGTAISVFVPAGSSAWVTTLGTASLGSARCTWSMLDAFYIGKFEVTNADWRRFREDPGYTDSEYWPSGRVVPKDQIPYWTQDAKSWGWNTEQRQLSRPGCQLGLSYGLLQLAEREDRQEVSSTDRSRVGKGCARHRPTAFSLGNSIDHSLHAITLELKNLTQLRSLVTTMAASVGNSRPIAMLLRTAHMTWRAM